MNTALKHIYRYIALFSLLSLHLFARENLDLVNNNMLCACYEKVYLQKANKGVRKKENIHFAVSPMVWDPKRKICIGTFGLPYPQHRLIHKNGTVGPRRGIVKRSLGYVTKACRNHKNLMPKTSSSQKKREPNIKQKEYGCAMGKNGKWYNLKPVSVSKKHPAGVAIDYTTLCTCKKCLKKQKTHSLSYSKQTTRKNIPVLQQTYTKEIKTIDKKEIEKVHVNSKSQLTPEQQRQKMIQEENIKYYQQSIETERQMKEREEAKLRAMRAQNNDGTFDRAIQGIEKTIKMHENTIRLGRSQLASLGGSEKAHIVRNNNDVEVEVKFNREVATDRKTRRDVNRLINEAEQISIKFSEDPQSLKIGLDTINRMRGKINATDVKSAKQLKDAFSKMFYESHQLKEESKSVYSAEQAAALDKSAETLKTYRDGALTINKYLAKLDPTGAGDKIVEAMEDSYEIIAAIDEGGLKGASNLALHLLDKKTNDYATVVYKETKNLKNLYDYTHGGYKVKKNEFYYDKNGKRLKVIKKYQPVYDKKGNRLNLYFERKLGQATIDHLNDTYNTPANIGQDAGSLVEHASERQILDAAEDNLNLMDAIDMGIEQYLWGKKFYHK